MKYYDLLFVGLMQIGEKTAYKGISEYVASWGISLIIELNLICLLIWTPGQSILAKTYIWITLFITLIFINIKYYNYRKITLDRLYNDLTVKFRPNMTSGELFAIIMILESVIIPPILILSHK